VSPYVVFVLVVLLPTALAYGLVAVRHGFKWAGDRKRLRSRTPEPEPGPEPESEPGPEPEPIDRLAANLRRLRAELEDMENNPGVSAEDPGLRALRGAYVGALGTACQRLRVGPPLSAGPAGGERARQADIYRAEAALRQRGLDVREPASR
jgi:hypothetical protein